MAKTQAYDLFCPKCGKKADTANPMFIRYSIYRLTLVIFLCGDCRTLHIDRPIIRQILSRWRKLSFGPQAIPFERLYQEFLGELKRMVRTYWNEIGYTEVRFVKRPKVPLP